VLTNQSSSSIPNGTFPNNLPAVSSWDGPSPQVHSENATTYTAQTPGTYSATITDLNNGCTAVVTLTIGDNRVYPDLTQTPTEPVVLDCGNTSVAISPVISNPSSAYSYNWVAAPTVSVAGATTKTLTVNQPGEYSVLVTNTVNGCSSFRQMEVENGELTAGFEPDQVSGVAPFTVNFTNTSSSTKGNDKIHSVWNFANSSSTTYTSVQSASTTYFQAGTYTVTLYVTKGTCLDTAYKIITVEVPSKLEIPNVFTPNGDGVNDFFFLKATNLTTIKAKIMDRWGHLVFENTSSTGNILWDGKNQYGKEAAAGTYFYVITASGADGQEYNYKGTLSIFR
jgi:gliding motility-associated-like protein